MKNNDKTQTLLPHLNPKVRHEFVLLMEAKNSLSNGDSNTGAPRLDPETNLGLWSPYSIKRGARDQVQDFHNGEEGMEVFIQKDVTLNASLARAYEENPDMPFEEEKDKEGKVKEGGKKTYKSSRENKATGADWMAQTFWDIRMFGGVLGTGDFKSNNVRGPVVLQWGRTVDPIYPQLMGLTRVAITKESDSEEKETEMGGITVVPYGLYVINGFFSPLVAKKSGVTPRDMAAFWEGLEWAPENYRSASRCGNSCMGLYVFSHSSEVGNAHAQDCHQLVQVQNRGVEAPRNFEDYAVNVREDALPNGVTLTRIYEPRAIPRVVGI